MYNFETEKVTQSITQQTTQQDFENQPKNQPQHKNIYIKLNYTKLNNIFNLIINNKAEEMNMTESAFQGFKLILKKLELIVTQDILNQLSQKQILEYKVIYYSLAELWKSSFVVLLYKLTREEIFHKLYKTEENLVSLDEIAEEDLEGFIGYFITCLQNILNGSDSNAKIRQT